VRPLLPLLAVFVGTTMAGGLGACGSSESSSGTAASAAGTGGASASAASSTSSSSTGVGGTSSASSGSAGGATTASSTSSSSTSSGACDYASNFDLAEDPISEGGSWVQQGALSGLDWSNVQTKNGIAFGTQTGNDGYDDSIALLSGFGPDHRVSAVIHFVGMRSDNTSTHEVELILRGSYTPHEQYLYECNLGYSGASGWYSQIVLQNGMIGTFTDITQGLAAVPDIKDGDVFTAEVIGDTINTYVNGLQVGTASAAAISTGQPGVGFFWRATENIDDYGFTSVCVTKL
jgi:hypothetical protein